MTRHETSYPKAAMVTGAGRRIGRAIALNLAARGFAVAVHFNSSEQEAAKTKREIEAKGGKAITLKADLSLESEVERLLPAAQDSLGPIGLLVNNASVFEYDSVETATRRGWDQHMEPNLRAPFRLSQLFAAALPKDACGLIVNLLDQRVWNLTPHFATYSVSKFALWGLTQSLALALAPRIRVMGIGPGPALPSKRQSQEQFDRYGASMPLGRGTTPEEICRALAFILETPSLTGQMIALDGGQHLGWAQAKGVEPPEE